MLFPTITFAVFFLLAFIGNWLLMPRQHVWKPFMLLVSLVFFGWWDWRFVLLLALSAALNQFFARWIAGLPSKSTAAKWALAAAVAANLGVLGWFKYYGFFVTSVVNFLGALNLNADLPLLRIVLPLGISFLTFRVLSYVIDVYRGTLRPASLLDFSVYVAFFPYLAAGPIARASEFLPQLRGPRDPRNVDTARAFFLIFGGLVKKMLIADYLATHLVNGVFTTPGQYSSLEVLLGIVGYSVQIYCDFSAYADIAIGVSLLLGFRLPDNFDRPYTARSVQEFWRRWHMTLSRWLRDYLYIPLGGNRKGRSRTYLNLMLTMVLGGLWHGAGWTFIFWGFLYGGALIVEHARVDRRKQRALLVQRQRRELALAFEGLGDAAPPSPAAADAAAGAGAEPPGAEPATAVEPALEYDREPWHGVWLPRLGTFAFVTFAWIFFRSDSFSAALAVIERLFQSWGTVGAAVTPGVFIAIAAGIGVQYVPRSLWERGEAGLSVRNPVLLGVALAVGFLLLDILGPTGPAAFLYFKF
jgi:D-alanyl-lipoteichoic acid acyltransferase DltB (MBOAT superfamily)